MANRRGDVKVGNIEGALAYILDWAGRTDIAVPGKQAVDGRPAALLPIAAVSDQLGPDFSSSHGIAAPLLNVQDDIIRPDEISVRDDVRLLAAENQGVWGYGYREDAPDTLLVSGDWCVRLGTREPESWRPVSATTKDALISVTLTNGVYALCEKHTTKHTDVYHTVPKETDVLIWRHAAWKGWTGFWANATNTLLHFGGMVLTLSRAA